MKSIKIVLIFFTLCISPLLCQNPKKYLPNKYGDTCPLRNSFTVGSMGYEEYKFQQGGGLELTAESLRKTCDEFGVFDANGGFEKISKYRGKIVIIGFWGTECDPSTKMLQEFVTIQSQIRTNKLDIELWPVHFEIWPVVNSFEKRNKARLGELVFKKIELASNGLSNLVDTLDGLPAIFIVDKNGKIAVSWIGFKEGLIYRHLNAMLAKG